jgi:hypothetical protein
MDLDELMLRFFLENLLVEQEEAPGRIDAALEIDESTVLVHVDSTNGRRKGNSVTISLHHSSILESYGDMEGRSFSQRGLNKVVGRAVSAPSAATGPVSRCVQLPVA